MSPASDLAQRTAISRIAVAVGIVQTVVSFAIVVATNAEGWFGGIAFAAMYAAPLFVLALAVRSSSATVPFIAGLSALALAVFYLSVVAGNWTGYSSTKAIAAVALTAPTVAVDAAMFWVGVVRARAAASHTPR